MDGVRLYTSSGELLELQMRDKKGDDFMRLNKEEKESLTPPPSKGPDFPGRN
jgi:hypothetical protein